MFNILIAALIAVTPGSFDMPPEGVWDSPAGATADQTAVRGTQVQVTETLPPPVSAPTVPPFADNCDEMSWYRQRAGLPARFDGIGWRESNCRNEDGVRTSCCHGWWQLNVGLHLRDHRLVGPYHSCGVYSFADVNSDTVGDKTRQACAAKALYDVVGLSAWAATR